MFIQAMDLGIVAPLCVLAGVLCIPASAVNNLPTSTMVPATGIPTRIPASPIPVPATAIPTSQPPSTDTSVTYGSLSFVVPPGVAGGASGSEYPRVDSEDAVWWQKTPGHLQVTLGDYYVLQGKFHQPQVTVYPAQAYAELVPPAFESLHRLNNILGTPNAPSSIDQIAGRAVFQ